MSRDFDVLIVGAGVVGTVAASLLLARKLVDPDRVAVIADRIPPANGGDDRDFDLRVFALARASQRLLQLCGAWQRLPPERVFPYERMCVWDASGVAQGEGSLTFDCAQIGEPNLGHIVDGRVLQERCLQSATAAGAVLIEAAVQKVALYDSDARLRLNDGRELSARLLIAADGTESKTRELLGIDTAGHAYTQDALVAHVRTAKPHRSTAWQRFLATGPLAFLPLPDGRSSIVWSTEQAEARRLCMLDTKSFAAALHAASGDALGEIELTTPVASFPLKLQYAVEYVRPRAVLLGDAAHVVHPLAGQGLNLGLLDCAALAEVLQAERDPRLLGDFRSLRRYERWRKSENLLAAAALDGLERLFSNDNPALARLRAGGLHAIDKLPFLKRRLAQRALGVIGDVPAFVRGDRSWPHK
jgi:2-octaprenylphenol hydroxylase